mmetsp:Transcript_7820/g.32652  ORF Transcript_7820/g.32652 Transcript_7820/m.32652 type:complete len:328 (+) Transcript_7820:1338-2321(+)
MSRHAHDCAKDRLDARSRNARPRRLWFCSSSRRRRRRFAAPFLRFPFRRRRFSVRRRARSRPRGRVPPRGVDLADRPKSSRTSSYRVSRFQRRRRGPSEARLPRWSARVSRVYFFVCVSLKIRPGRYSHGRDDILTSRSQFPPWPFCPPSPSPLGACAASSPPCSPSSSPSSLSEERRPSPSPRPSPRRDSFSRARLGRFFSPPPPPRHSSARPPTPRGRPPRTKRRSSRRTASRRASSPLCASRARTRPCRTSSSGTTPSSDARRRRSTRGPRRPPRSCSSKNASPSTTTTPSRPSTPARTPRTTEARRLCPRPKVPSRSPPRRAS